MYSMYTQVYTFLSLSSMAFSVILGKLQTGNIIFSWFYVYVICLYPVIYFLNMLNRNKINQRINHVYRPTHVYIYTVRLLYMQVQEQIR